MTHVMFPTVTVIICAYTAERWVWLLDVLDSLRLQTCAPSEDFVVVDHNELMTS